MTKELRVLHIEDSGRDAELISRHLSRSGYSVVTERVDTADAMKDALAAHPWDIIFCDYSMPNFNSLLALAILKEMGLDIPFVIVSGTIGEVRAVEAMRAGAQDYLMKDNLARLVPTVERELQEAKNRRARRHAEEELRAMTQQLFQAGKLATMGELAASIAHELNNPLATICLRAERLDAELTGDDAKRAGLQIILQEAERMADLVSNLLQFSRRSTAQISAIDLAEELKVSLEFIEYYLVKHNVKVVREIETDFPTVLADQQLIRQVFMNLQTNAADAMGQGGTLTVRMRRGFFENGSPAVVIEFSDTGEGIQPGHLEHVWEPFFTTKAEGKGTGLGLSICRRVIEENNGTINIESVAAKGTTVRIMLPA